MDDIDKHIKTGLEFGVGLTYLTIGALTQVAKKLEKEGKINRKDSEKLVKDFLKQYQSEGGKYAKQAEAYMKKNPFATKKDIAEINARINQINKLIKKYSK